MNGWGDDAQGCLSMAFDFVVICFIILCVGLCLERILVSTGAIHTISNFIVGQ
jgi:hypothetical protein